MFAKIFQGLIQKSHTTMSGSCLRSYTKKVIQYLFGGICRKPHDGLPIDPLRADTVDFLSDLPVEQHFEWRGVSVYVTHENPMHDPSKFIYPTSSRSLCQSVASAANTQIIILGHTHPPMHLQIGNTHILNPGSVFANHGPYEQTCGILHLPECRLNFAMFRPARNYL